MKTVSQGYFLVVSSVFAIASLSLPPLSHAAKVGEELVEKFHADMNGDGVEDTILLRKTVTLDFPGAPGYYDYDVVIEIIDGKDQQSLFKSQKFHTDALGVVVTQGELKVLSTKRGPSKLEYIETTYYTEGPGPDRVINVKKHLFEWNGREIEVRVISSEK